MKVKELIEKLKEFPEDTLVLTTGYEGEMDLLGEPQIVKVQKNNLDKWYYGDYSVVGLAPDEDIPIETAVYFPRTKI